MQALNVPRRPRNLKEATRLKQVDTPRASRRATGLGPLEFRAKEWIQSTEEDSQRIQGLGVWALGLVGVMGFGVYGFRV